MRTPVYLCLRSRLAMMRWVPLIALGLMFSSCATTPAVRNQPVPVRSTSDSTESPIVAVLRGADDATVLTQSWQQYRQRFIQPDGRVIDREASDRSTSEGQAYALLRAVLMDDPETFERVLAWSENNLQRRDLNGNRSDHLWVWKWGKNAEGIWGVIDPNFASDGDIDAITALIFASRQWDRADYLDLARIKLQDLWNLSTITVSVASVNDSENDPGSGSGNGSQRSRYLLPGPRPAFQPQSDRIYLNPSYFAPYAFRLFAQIDPNHDWTSLIDSSYRALIDSAQLSSVGLPSDWVALDTKTGGFLPITDSDTLRTIYGFDAYRVWWRVALDAAWFDEPLAKQYLEEQTRSLQELWRSQQRIPAQIDLQGNPLVNYESTAQYAMLYAALHIVDPEAAEQIRQQKLLSSYQDGFWDNDSAYYTQNLGWFGLFPSSSITTKWLQP